MAKRALVLILPALLALVAGIRSADAASARYTVTDLGTLPGAGSSYASDINDSGQVVGYATNAASGIRHAFLYSGGVMTDLGINDTLDHPRFGINAGGQIVGTMCPVPKTWPARAFLYSGGVFSNLGSLYGSDSGATGINAGGQVVGISDGSVFLYSGGVMTDLGIPADLIHTPAINDAGQIAGYYQGSFFGYHTFLYSGGVLTDLGIPRAPNYAKVDINAHGQIVGTFIRDYGDTNGFLFSEGVLTPIRDSGAGIGVYYSASGLNDNGQVVGSVRSANYSTGYIYSGGVISLLDDLIDPASGWHLSDAQAINNLGQIVGYGTNAAGETRGFLLNPVVPEPATMCLLGLAVSGLGGYVRRRRAA